MEVYILTEEAYERLKSDLYAPEGAARYLDPALRSNWDLHYRRVGCVLKYELPAQEKLIGEPMEDLKESDRGKLIFHSFRDITPLQASSKLLWATLTHYEYRDFCCNKWFKEADRHSDSKKLEGRILNRMFYRAGLNGVQRNAIARYYWGAKKTYELWKSGEIISTRFTFDDPYHLTEYMLNDSQIWQDTMQRAIGASDYLRFAYLISAKNILEYLLEKTQRNTISGDHYSKWLSKLFTCWINGCSYRSLSVDEAIDNFTGEAIYLLAREQG